MGLFSAVKNGITSGFGGIGGLLDAGNKKAAKKATKAVTEAADKNRQLFEQIYNQSRADLAPYNQAGQAALARYQQRLGLTPVNRSTSAPAAGPASKAAPQPYMPTQQEGYTPMSAGQKAAIAAAQAPNPRRAAFESSMDGGGYGSPVDSYNAAPSAGQSGPDWQAYLDANPDVAQNAAQRAAAEGIDPLQVAQQHWQAYGQTEGRTMPQMGEAPADPNAPPEEYYQETYADRPAELDIPAYERGQDVQFQDYGQGPQFSYTTADIENDPGYRFALNEGLKGVNSNFAARGRLRSGGAAKALQDRGTGVAHQFDNDFFNRALQTYGANRSAFESNRGFGEDRDRFSQNRTDRNFLDDRSYGTNLWNTRQGRADNIFSEDRGFAANRNDVQNNNLFNLMNAGQNAAAGTANAGNVFAGNVAAGNNNVAQTTANGALWRQGQLQNMFGSALNFAGQFVGGGF